MEHKETETGRQGLGFGGLTAIVFGMMVGAGIYNIPQNMAMGASLGGVIVSWVITAVGMLLLVATFKTLADRRPDLSAGIYEYAQAGWGNYTGFNMAWGYWLCTSFANIAYAVMLNDAFGAFFPEMVGNGLSEVLSGSLLVWVMYLVVSRGLRTAKIINTFLAVLKVLAIVVIIVLLALNLKISQLTSDLWGQDLDPEVLWKQVKDTMMVTLWCFIGIEGAVMMSSRARRPSDVGKAGVSGFLISWVMYILVSALSYGIMGRGELSGLENPSVAYVLRAVCGDWAYYFVIISVIVSLAGGWVSWTLVCAQVPHQAASVGIFPKRFLELNRHGMPAFGLAVSSVIMQLFLLIVVVAKDVYLAALSITGMMILPAYLFSGLYLWKTTVGKSGLGSLNTKDRIRFRITGILCVLFCLWMIYAGGTGLFLLTTVFYVFGIGFYVVARFEQTGCRKIMCAFTRAELLLACAITVCAVLALVLLCSGKIII